MKYFFYILIFGLIVGCKGIDRPKKPKDLIAKDRMSDIMYDLYILNAAKGINKKVLEINGIMPIDYVYKKHGVDSLQFAESNTYYAYDIEVYAKLVEKVKAEFQKEKELFEKLTEEEQKSRNELRKLGTPVIDTLPNILPQ